MVETNTKLWSVQFHYPFHGLSENHSSSQTVSFFNQYCFNEKLRIEISKITNRFDIISLHHVGEEIKKNVY